MADRKISAFATITGSQIDASSDSIPVVDASAGASLAGNKRITISELMTRAPVQPSNISAAIAAEAATRTAVDQSLQTQISAIVGGSAITTENSFSTRAAFVAWAASASGLIDGMVVYAAGLAYVRQATATTIHDLAGWVPGGLITTRHFGAIAGANSTTALQAALSSGLPLLHDIYCTASAALTHNGSVMLHGIGKGQCGITWTTPGAEGIAITPASWSDEIEISGMDLLTQSATPTGTALYINWLPLGPSGIPYFDRRAYLEKLRIAGDARYTTGWKKGIVCNFPFAVEIRDCEIWGKAEPTAVLPGDFIAGSIGIDIPNQTTRSLANFGIADCVVMCMQTAAYIRNVEGFWAEGNDFQICHDGLISENTIAQVNQYRVRFNHFGVSGRQAAFKWCRQIIFEGNEVSYRQGRTDLAVINLIELDTCYGFTVLGNNIRGNVTSDAAVLVDGIAYLWTITTNPANYTRRGVVQGNNFQNLRNGERNDAGTNLKYVARGGNTYDGIRNDRLVVGSGNASLTATQYFGTGDFEAGDPAGSNTAAVMTNLGAAVLSVDRQGSDGGVIVIRRDGAVVGSISTTTSGTTYSTTSDARLKTPGSVLTASEALAVLRKIVVRNFMWSATGESDIGAFAQELYEVFPAAVTPGEGEPGEAGFVPWGVDYNKLMPLMIAAIAGEAE